jgi:hypothetical protein
MGTTKKIKTYKRPLGNKVRIVTTKPRDLTDAQWKRLSSGEDLFPEKTAKAKEMLAKTTFMDEKTRSRLNKHS